MYALCVKIEVKRYYYLALLYTFEQETATQLAELLSRNVQRRRLEKGLSREALAMMSGVPAPTIAKFERQHTIGLVAYVALAQALGYSSEVKQLLFSPKYQTMEELEQIKRNRNRQRGRNEFNK